MQEGLNRNLCMPTRISFRLPLKENGAVITRKNKIKIIFFYLKLFVKIIRLHAM